MTTKTFLFSSFLPIINVIFLLSTSSSSSAHRKTLTVELIHRDSPRSPLYNPLHSASDRLNASFHRSISRSRHFATKAGLLSGLRLSSSEYFMSVSIGTPPLKLLALVDTGSDLNWIQCKPCVNYCNLTSPIFDKSISKTYKTEPCSSNHCEALEDAKECNNTLNICNYHYLYKDGSFTKGDIATETFSIGSSSASHVPFPDIVFGCSYQNNDTNKEEYGSGIIGLGGGPLSFISQLGTSIGRKFSYCLSDKSSKSFINLGYNSIPSNTRNDSAVLETPLTQDPSKTYYFLTLEAISVGTLKLPYPQNLTERTGNIVIDSGTTYTFLKSVFFYGFSSAVEKSMTGAMRVTDPKGNLKLCFKTGHKKLVLPEITMHFTGADVKLSPRITFLEFKDMVCLVMVPTTDQAIYGNMVQIDYLVGYDLDKKTVSFQHMHCSKNP